jgi:hypothetical protein
MQPPSPEAGCSDSPPACAQLLIQRAGPQIVIGNHILHVGGLIDHPVTRQIIRDADLLNPQQTFPGWRRFARRPAPPAADSSFILPRCTPSARIRQPPLAIFSLFRSLRLRIFFILRLKYQRIALIIERFQYRLQFTQNLIQTLHIGHHLIVCRRARLEALHTAVQLAQRILHIGGSCCIDWLAVILFRLSSVVCTCCIVSHFAPAYWSPAPAADYRQVVNLIQRIHQTLLDLRQTTADGWNNRIATKLLNPRGGAFG